MTYLEELRRSRSRFETLSLHPSNFADGDDVEEAGRAILANTSIEHLNFWGFCGTDVAKYRPIFVGISRNESIKSIDIHYCEICKEFITIIGKSISKLVLYDCTITMDVFAAVFQMSNSFSDFTIMNCTFKLNQSIIPSKRAKLESIVDKLSCNFVRDQNIMIRLASTLPNLTLRELYMNGNWINTKSARALSQGISQNKTIEILELEKLQIAEDEDDIELIISAILSHLSRLKKLSLAGNRSITDTVMSTLTDALTNNSTLEVLDLGACRCITSMCWLSLSRWLGSSRCLLKELNLHYTTIDDDVITAFANDLSRNRTLEVLDLGFCEDITPTGWLTFSRLLGSHSILRDFEVSGNFTTDEVVAAYTNELSGNETSQLKRLNIYMESDYNRPSISNDIWDPLKNLLCNTTGINSTWSSNHTLCDLGKYPRYSDEESDDEDIEMPVEMYDLLEMNKDEDKKQVARRKVIKYHFSGDFDVNALIGSDQKLLPRKISWFGRDELGLSVVYSIIRTLPDLCQND